MFRSLVRKSEKKRIKEDELTDLRFEFQEFNSKQFAEENNLEYIKQGVKGRIKGEEYINKVYAYKGHYIDFIPPNDGMPTCPIEWYTNIKGRRCLLIDNQEAFNAITNLEEVLLKMIELYMKYLDEDVVISSLGFGLKLEDEISENYVGRASLVVTENTIKNEKVPICEFDKAKRYCINQFLDHFIGWNFGVVVENYAEVESRLKELNNLVISRGYRKYAGPGFDVWHSEDVKPYALKDKIAT